MVFESVDKVASFTAAETVPVKLFLHEGVAQLRPVHVNWFPTNHCNLNCDFCSCAARDKSLEMPLDRAVEVMADFRRLGCEAVTISGGGEPLCHPHLVDMIREFSRLGIEVGLVTNGLLLDSLPLDVLGLLTWCRISHADTRRLSGEYRRVLDRATEVPIDWAFSHVVGKTPNLPQIRRVVKYANEHDFTHVRLVGNLMEPEAVPFGSVHEAICDIDDLVIYQPRKRHVQSTSCLVGYVKPMVAADFKMYLCCGVQYALEPMSLNLPEALCMGSATDLDAVYGNPQPIGVKCARCYYDSYNQVLRAMTSQVKHREFV